MKPIIYKSSDTGAPQLTNVAGSMNAVIKGCLVTGYSSKLAAGWEIVYEDLASKKMAIRSTSPKSIKSVLLLDNIATGYATATAFTGWNSANNTGVSSFGAGYIVNKWNMNTPNWVLIATDRFFYIFVQMDAGVGYRRVPQAFGDVNTLINATEGCCALIACAGVTDTPSNVAFSKIQTSMGAAKFPILPFDILDKSFGWGDKSALNPVTKSSTSVLSRFPLYVNKDGMSQPFIELMGMLMPYSEIVGYELGADNIHRLSGQNPYSEPLVGIQQAYIGFLWLHTDDWG